MSNISDLLSHVLNGPTGLIAVKRMEGTYFVMKDHLGSTRVIVNGANGEVVNYFDYTPYGNTMRVGGGIGVKYQFTGQEYDDETGLWNFRARLYDDELGIFYAVDPAGQNFSPFSYAGNNPIIFVDENGRWFGIDDLIAAAIGGVVNLTVNLIQGNVGNFWEGLGYFGAGAAAGTLALYGPAGWAAGGAIVGASNSALGGAQGWDIVTGGVIGGVSGVAGGYAGQWAAQGLGGAIINGFQISSPVVQGVIGGAAGGAVGGYAGGFTSGFLMTGDLSAAHQSGIGGLWTGAGIGGVIGGGSAYSYARQNNLDPWTGKALTLPEELPSGLSTRDQTSLVTKYPANAEISGTIKNEYLFPGTRVDRYGDLYGNWLSPEGTPYGMRSIPPDMGPYSSFTVVKPFPVQSSLASPGFFYNQVGFGVQYRTPVSIDILIRRGFLR